MHSIHHLQQFRLKDEFALFILLALLVRFVILPANSLIALLTYYVSYNVSAGGHVALHGFSSLDIDDSREQKGFAMLATEVLEDEAVS